MLDHTFKALYYIRPQTYKDSEVKSKSQKTRRAQKLRYFSKSKSRNYRQDQQLTTKDACYKKTTTKLLAC